MNDDPFSVIPPRRPSPPRGNRELAETLIGALMRRDAAIEPTTIDGWILHWQLQAEQALR
jgi:hypothetical protein